MKPNEQGSRSKIKAKKRVLIVDDHEVVRHGLARLLNTQPDLTVCGEASTLHEASQAIANSKPDVVILDLNLGNHDGEGIEGIKFIKRDHAQLPVLVFSVHNETEYAERAFRAGAAGYMMKGESLAAFLAALRTVLDGKKHMSERMLNHFAHHFVGGQKSISTSPAAVLSDREMDVFRLIGQGKATSEIAKILHISPKTVGAPSRTHQGKAESPQRCRVAPTCHRVVATPEFVTEKVSRIRRKVAKKLPRKLHWHSITWRLGVFA